MIAEITCANLMLLAMHDAGAGDRDGDGYSYSSFAKRFGWVAELGSS